MTGIRTNKSNGLVTYEVVIRGVLLSAHMSHEAAKTKVLRLLNTIKGV